MSDKAKIAILYDSATGVIRKATSSEQAQIQAAYKLGKEPPRGSVEVSFSQYGRTDMLKIYSALEYASVGSVYKTMNLAKAIQIKLNDLRASVGKTDADDIVQQAQQIVKALKAGCDVALDGKDTIETARPDLTAADAALSLINQKRSFYLGLPASWITGLSKNSMGDTGEGDAKKVEQGLKAYFAAIVKPVVDALFGKNVTFKSDDFRQMGTALELLKTLELVSEEFISADNKLKLINKAFGFADGTKGGDKPAAPQLPAPAAGGQNVVQG